MFLLNEPTLWTSLEITKLVISALGPLIGGIIAWRLTRFESRIGKVRWVNEKLIEKRLEVYEKTVPHLNELYCYFCYVGNWKELYPKEIIAIKRKVDKDMYVFAPLFSPGVLEAYNTFIDTCFQMFSGTGKDARLRTKWEKRQKAFPNNWEEEWNDLFTEEDNTIEIRNAFYNLMNRFKVDLDVFHHGEYLIGKISHM